jgi:hypothetical protein
LQWKKVWPSPFSCSGGQPPPTQQAVPPAQHVDPHPACGPAGHRHAPEAQLAVAGHALPHAPQFVASVSVLVQPPAQQAWPSPQVAPHAPQFCGSVCVLLHSREQQVRPAPQATPHSPQFASSTARLTQLTGSAAGHSSGSDAGHAHAPPTQTALESGQGRPHAKASVPQFSGSVSRSVQKVSQSSGRGSKHPHAPPEHDSPGRTQACPQAVASVPQFCGSVRVCLQGGLSPAQSVPPSHWQTPPAQVPNPQSTPQPPQ